MPATKKKKKQDEEKVCDYCGAYEECNGSRHNINHIRDLLVDAGIVEDNDFAFTSWFRTNHIDKDPDMILLGHDPDTVWGVYPNRVAKFVRSIL